MSADLRFAGTGSQILCRTIRPAAFSGERLFRFLLHRQPCSATLSPRPVRANQPKESFVSRVRMSRRATLAAIAATPAIAAVPACAALPVSPETRVKEALARITLPFAPATLDLVRLTEHRHQHGTALAAVIRLTWPPGMRQRGFKASGATLSHAIDALENRIRQTFAEDAQV